MSRDTVIDLIQLVKKQMVTSVDAAVMVNLVKDLVMVKDVMENVVADAVVVDVVVMDAGKYVVVDVVVTGVWKDVVVTGV